LLYFKNLHITKIFSMTEESRKSLPFEPGTNKPRPTVAKRKPVIMNKPERDSTALAASRIPDVVGKRMITRSVILSGTPTVLGMLVFIGSYFAITHGIKLPNVLVLLVSMGCLGLGVLGLSYGILSASWEEHQEGTWLGLAEFKLNFGRMKEGYQKSKVLQKDLP
jgi:Photosynthesis affected mutant 68